MQGPTSTLEEIQAEFQKRKATVDAEFEKER